MTRRTFTLTPAVIKAAAFIRELDCLKAADTDLLASAKPTQRPGIKRAIARRQRLRRELQKWLSDEVRAQRGQLPIGHWDD